MIAYDLMQRGHSLVLWYKAAFAREERPIFETELRSIFVGAEVPNLSSHARLGCR